MNAYIYQAALYCEDCGHDAALDCQDRSVEDTGDSDDYPQGPYANGGGKADCPQHCNHCGTFLENPLTSDGYNYVRWVAEEQKGKLSETVSEWVSFYDISLPENEEPEQGELF